MNAPFETAKQLFLEGTSALEQGDLATAELKLTECLRLMPGRASTQGNLAVLYVAKAGAALDQGRVPEAIALYEKAIDFDATHVPAHQSLGGLLASLNQNEKALACYDRALGLLTDQPALWINRASLLNTLGRHADALASCDRAIAINPNFAAAWINHSNALNDLGRPQEALASADRALEIDPHSPEAWTNRGAALSALKRYDTALTAFDRAIALMPHQAEIWRNRGDALRRLKRHEDALASYDQALRIRPDFARAWGNRGALLSDIKRHQDAVASYQRAIEFDPAMDFLLGDLIYSQVQICEWKALDSRLSSLSQALLNDGKPSVPFAVLSVLDSPSLQKKAADVYVKSMGQVTSQRINASWPAHPRIRVGYFSMDFREHPVSALVVEMLERHDRGQFEIYAFAFGASSPDPMRARITKAVDAFIDVNHLSDAELVALARHHQIDIAIDLAGHTHSSRPKIFMDRVAPVQINYIGFPGTWGSDCMDYIIGDRVVINEQNKNYFSEKIIFMPDQFQVNPSERPFIRSSASRGAYGIADDAFVFCCFNNSWKVMPEVFQRWMRILNAVPRAVLWIYADNPTSADNLRVEAARHGVAPSRLIVAGRIPIDAYLARFTCADLFLDTWPYNAGTTASDALWAGLPVLTQAGASFAARMAASLLQSVGLPELITESGPAYEALAIELAHHPDQLAALRKRLIENRASAPLFDTARFTKNIEQAFREVHARSRAGLSPDHIDIAP